LAACFSVHAPLPDPRAISQELNFQTQRSTETVSMYCLMSYKLYLKTL